MYSTHPRSNTESLVDRALEPVIHYASPVGANIYAKVAQTVEHSTENAGVGGSIPPLGTWHYLSSKKCHRMLPL